MKGWLKRKAREYDEPEPMSGYRYAVIMLSTMIYTVIVVEIGLAGWETIPMLFAIMGILFLFRWWIRRE